MLRLEDILFQSEDKRRQEKGEDTCGAADIRFLYGTKSFQSEDKRKEKALVVQHISGSLKLVSLSWMTLFVDQFVKSQVLKLGKRF